MDYAYGFFDLLLIKIDLPVLPCIFSALLSLHCLFIDLLELGGVADITEVALASDYSPPQHYDFISILCEVGCVGGHDNSFAPEMSE